MKKSEDERKIDQRQWQRNNRKELKKQGIQYVSVKAYFLDVDKIRRFALKLYTRRQEIEKEGDL